MQEYLRIVYESYQERSHLDDEPNMKWGTKADKEGPKIGRPDDWGNSWEQLRPKTYRLKKKGNQGGKYAEYLEGKKFKAAKEIAARIRNSGGEMGSGDFINIRTGQLLASYAPGPIINNVLQVNTFQNVEFKGTGIHFDNNNVPHADKANNQYNRPIIPEDSEPQWIAQAFDVAMDAAEKEYLRIKNRGKSQWLQTWY